MRVAALLGLLALISADAAVAERTFNAVPMQSGVLDVNGVAYPYVMEGKGEPCLFVGPATLYSQLLSDEIKQSIGFVFVDYKQTWNAPDGADLSSVTLQSLVDEVDAVRTALNLNAICLISHSTPGFVALEYAIQHPEHVSRMILIGAPAYQNPSAEGRRKAFWDQDASPARKARYADNLRRWPDERLSKLPQHDRFMFSYSRGDPYYFYDYRYDSVWMQQGQYFSSDLAVRFYRVITADYDPRPRLTKNQVPIFSAIGRYDYITPAYLWDGIDKQVPKIDVVRFDHSGHFPMIEEQRRFDQELRRWLAQTGGAARKER